MGSSGIRAFVLLAVAALLALLDTQAAYAQSAQCRNLMAALRQFDGNADFRQFDGNSRQVRELARQVQDAESQYIRGGCNDDARAGRTLTPQCQQIARAVLRLRDDYQRVSQSVDTASAVAGQREAILQEMARFGCGSDSGSSATFSPDRQSVFDRIFGSTSEGDFTDGQFIDGGDYWGNQGYNTVRTVCVRLSDGYFWPISYSTLPDYIGNDAQMCQQSCPNTPVDLYYYSNPGEEPEQMRNMNGSPYTALPSAFAYRNSFDTSASCRAKPASDGTVTLASGGEDGGVATLSVNGVNVPLPRRDPRGVTPVQAAAVAEPVAAVALVDVPLPRRRPAGPGEVAVEPTVTAQDSAPRIISIEDRRVRVVGPDTPYARAGQAGT